MSATNIRNLLLATLVVVTPPAWSASDVAPGKTAASSDGEAAVVGSSPRTVIVNPSAKFKMTFNRSKPESKKLYCRRDMVTGSHKKKVRCISKRNKRAEEEAAREFLLRAFRSH